MNYKETLYFVAKCLTISLEEINRDEIELILKTSKLDWDAVVKVSTSHYVFPALYCNLQRANFLHYLPKELVSEFFYTQKPKEAKKKTSKSSKEKSKVTSSVLNKTNFKIQVLRLQLQNQFLIKFFSTTFLLKNVVFFSVCCFSAKRPKFGRKFIWKHAFVEAQKKI